MGLTTDERARLKALERESRDLRRANEILKDASIFMSIVRLCRFPARSMSFDLFGAGKRLEESRHNHSASRKASSLSGGRKRVHVVTGLAAFDSARSFSARSACW